MSDFKREKNVLRQLEKARNAIKRKYRMLKYGKDDAQRVLNETFKPIVDPLQMIVSETKKKNRPIIPIRRRRNASKKAAPDFTHTETTTDSEDSDTTLQNDTIQAYESAADESMVEEEETDEYLQMLDNNKTNFIDLIYGVRKEDGQYMIGDLPIYFEKDKVKINNAKYPRTVGLMELLIAKQPNQSYVSAADLQNYRKILEMSSAHKKRYDENETIRAHNSNKFYNIIGPMFNVVRKPTTGEPIIKGGGSLPRYKIAKNHVSTDYVYWDDPNELVDRLRLLVAERAAGNPSHTNEIHSIIEELRESGYIY